MSPTSKPVFLARETVGGEDVGNGLRGGRRQVKLDFNLDHWLVKSSRCQGVGSIELNIRNTASGAVSLESTELLVPCLSDQTRIFGQHNAYHDGTDAELIVPTTRPATQR